MATQIEEAELIQQQVTQLQSVAAQIGALNNAVVDLQAQVAALQELARNASPEVIAAVQSLADQVQVVDDLVPDLPPPPPPPNP